MDDPIGDDELAGYVLLGDSARKGIPPLHPFGHAIARLIGEVQRLRQVTSDAIDALEVDDPAVRRTAFHRLLDQFEGVNKSPDGWIERAADEIAGDPSCSGDADRVVDIIRGHKVRGA